MGIDTVFNCKIEVSFAIRKIFMFIFIYFIQFLVPHVDVLLGTNMLHKENIHTLNSVNRLAQL